MKISKIFQEKAIGEIYQDTMFSNSEGEGTCPSYIMNSINHAAKVFGLDIYSQCCITESSSKLYLIYVNFVEGFLWFIVIIISNVYISDNTAIFSTLTLAFGDHIKSGTTVILAISIYAALQFSIIKRKKISLHYPKSSYVNESKILVEMESYIFLTLSIFFFLMMIIFFTILSILFHNHLHIAKISDAEVLFCLVIIPVWLFYVVGQIFCIFVTSFIIFIILGRRYVKITNELEARNQGSPVQNFLEDLIYKHLELGGYFELLNSQWDILLPIIYGYFVNVVSFFLYAAIFADMEPFMRKTMMIISFISCIGIIFVARALSFMTSLIYDNYVSVGRFYSQNLPLEFKFKIIDFMKKFGRTPIGISIGGFFFVKKNFLIRVISGLYSSFSSLIQLNGVLGNKKCSSSISKYNVPSNISSY